MIYVRFFFRQLLSVLFLYVSKNLMLLCVFASVEQQEILSLYQRFCQLDRNAKGFISSDEFLSVPEFAMNPLSQVFDTFFNPKSMKSLLN